MKAPTATLKTLFSQENDSSFAHYLSIQTESSKKVSDLFINLNTGDHMLAALAFNSTSEPLVILDAELSRRKASLVVLSKDLNLDVVLLEDSSTLDKTTAVSNIPISVHPSYFQGKSAMEEESNAEAYPACLIPSEWIGFMIDEDSDSLSLSALQANLMAKLSKISSLQDQIEESPIIKNLCNFLSLGGNESNSSQLKALKLGAFAENLGNSQPVRAMKAKLEDIKAELQRVPNTETMENSINDSIGQHRQATSPPLSAAERAKAEAEAEAKRKTEAKAKEEAENRKRERDGNPKDDTYDSDSNSDEDSDSSSVPVFLGNKKATPSKFDLLNKMYSIDKFAASDKDISRNLKRQKLVGENGVIQGFMQSSRCDDHLALGTLANGKVVTELNDTFTEILTYNKDKKDIARALKKAVKKISPHLRIEDQIDQVCTKTTEFLLSGEPFVEKDVHKEEDLTGFSFMSIPLPNRNSITKNGAKYYIPKTAEDFILQLKVFIGYLIILFARKPSRELKEGAGKRDKNSGICLLARDLLQQVIDSKPSISSTLEKHTAANFDIARRIHNKFIKVVFSHITQEKAVIGAKLTCKVIEDISESYYRPPQAPKPSKPTGGDGGRNRSDDGRGNGGSQNKGYFYFKREVFKKIHSHKDKIPKFNSKPACLKCAWKGTKKCFNSDNEDLFHGPYGQNHETKMKALGDAMGTPIVKNNRRG